MEKTVPPFTILACPQGFPSPGRKRVHPLTNSAPPALSHQQESESPYCSFSTTIKRFEILASVPKQVALWTLPPAGWGQGPDQGRKEGRDMVFPSFLAANNLWVSGKCSWK